MTHPCRQHSKVLVAIAMVVVQSLTTFACRAQDPDFLPIETSDIVLQREIVVRTSDLAFPVFGTHAGDESGRLFIVDKLGTVHILQDDQLQGELFLDIREDTIDSGPRGLLGMAFHPGYADEQSAGFGKLYTFHNTDDIQTPDFSLSRASHQNIVTEWMVDAANPNVVDPSSRREKLASTHPGTILRIDPLDPAVTSNSTDPISANGKYRIPAENPFLDDEDAIDELIRLRVPQSMAIQLRSRNGCAICR